MRRPFARRRIGDADARCSQRRRIDLSFHRHHPYRARHGARAVAITEQYGGDWKIARSIFDCDEGTSIICAGVAQLRPHDGALRYDEAVSFLLAGKLIHATRAYRFTSAAGMIVATFSDGAPFFRLRLSADGIGTAVHHCAQDRYALTLTLREPAAWQTQWDVSGTKRLRIISRYVR